MIAQPLNPTENQEWLRGLKQRAAHLRVPLRGMLELTSRCNLRCVHCYLGSQDEQHARREEEMSTERVKSLIDEIIKAGCLYLTITGGDPMMRRDFREIYTYARVQGLLVTVFCDAILVTDKILELFKAYPPRMVEVSIYGATAPTYERVTRVPGSFPKALEGIRALIDHGIRVRLKTVLMELNKHEIHEMEGIAVHLGVPFRFDSAIFPCLPQGSEEAGTENDHAPLDLRVSPQEVVDIELASPERRRHWREAYGKASALPETDRLYSCGAGQTSFYVDPYANVSPCLMTSMHRHSLEGTTFRERWDNDLVKIREKKRSPDAKCAVGGMRGLCTACPGANYLETGDENHESEYSRQIAELRYNAIVNEDRVAPKGA
ncbi:MAG: radical SAM protein [Verrucomicrobia bacterium]|nr:radical SAM protein [Verrucomicrobiota bacterium]MDA1087217.1 radical SAM protein [Verrucomicrobiota bacterium]